MNNQLIPEQAEYKANNKITWSIELNRNLTDIFQDLKISHSDDNKKFKDSITRCLDRNTQLASRYFQQDLFSYCYKCKQSGHQDRKCTQLYIVSCYYCLDTTHKANRCPHQVCYNCRHKGHRKVECRNKRTPRIDLFGCIDQSELQCLNCNQMGHSNCHDTTEFNDDIY